MDDPIACYYVRFLQIAMPMLCAGIGSAIYSFIGAAAGALLGVMVGKWAAVVFEVE